MKGLPIKLLPLLVLLWTSSRVSAAIPIDQKPNIEISALVDIYLDRSREVSIEEIAASDFGQFHPSSMIYPSFGIFPGNAWFRFELQNTLDYPTDTIITLGAPLLDVRLYEKEASGGFGVKKAGRLYSDEETSFPSRMPSFKVTLGPGEIRQFYIMSHSELVYSVKIYLRSLESYAQNERSQIYFGGFYAGIMAIMIFYNAFLWYSTKEISFLWYILTVFFMHFNVVSVFNVNGDIFGIKNPILPRYYILLNKILGMMALMQFSRVFLRTRQSSPLVDGVLRYQLYASVPLLGLVFVWPNVYLNVLHNVLVITGMVMTLIYSGYLFRKGHRYARFYFIAWFPLLFLGAGLVTLNALGYGRWFATAGNFLLLVPISEVLLLSMALGDKLNEMKLSQQRSEREHKEQILAINQSLEQTVREKTRDIRSMLDNLKIGIFTIDRSLEIGSDHSQYLSTIVGQKAVDKPSAIQLMFTDSNLGPDRVNQVESALLSIIGAEDYGFIANEQMLIRSYQRHAGGIKQHLEVDWTPILDDADVVQKVLVSMRDVTEVNDLRLQNQQHQRRVETLEQCLDLGNDKLSSIIIDLDDITSRLRNLTDEAGVGALFADVHTVKAQTRQYQLTFLSDALHILEDYLQAVRSHRDVLQRERIAERMALLEETLDDYKKIVNLLGGYQQKAAGPSHMNLELLLVDCLAQRASLAHELDKPCPAYQIDLQENLELDGAWCKALSTALVHLVRNSLDHGLESTSERLMLGKNPEGLIVVRLRQTHRGYRLEYSDDGRGLDLDRIKARAVKRELLRPDQLVSDEEVAAVIFQPGFSTKDAVSQISGRGVGLDAAVQSLHKLGAAIRIELGPASGSNRPVKFVLDFPRPVSHTQKAS